MTLRNFNGYSILSNIGNPFTMQTMEDIHEKQNIRFRLFMLKQNLKWSSGVNYCDVKSFAELVSKFNLLEMFISRFSELERRGHTLTNFEPFSTQIALHDAHPKEIMFEFIGLMEKMLSSALLPT